ncbi:MAG: type II secretion system protein GspG [Phycisphaerae bacterium]|nr:type II secretion system protein GspG [Phycisphaerae bacterium]
MQKRRTNRARGFTLLEMMLVVVIMGILATVVVVSFGGRTEAAKIGATKSKMTQIKAALSQYEAQYSTLPATLDALTVGAAKFLDKIPKDGWNKDFVYVFPSANQDPEKPYDLRSNGKDGLPNTADDLDIWTIDRQP